MKRKIKTRFIILAAVNLAAIAAAAVLSLVGSSLAKSQRYNYAADRWTQGAGGCTQVSCFFSDDSGFVKDSIMSVRMSLLNSLESAAVVQKKGQTLCPAAYSAPVGRFQVTCDRPGSSQADVTAVGGEFFLFRSFDLLHGNYISDSDLMQDGAVIDRTLAFSLYGSDNIAGMNIYINNTSFRIAGVIDDPRTKYERECAGDYPKAYISYTKAAELSGGEPFSKVSCYEVIVPDPVENFGFSAVEKIFGNEYEGKVILVNNTKRFTTTVRAAELKSISRRGVRQEAISLPYWENASRIVEHKLTVIYSIRRGLLAIPLMTLLWAIVKTYRRLKSKRKNAFSSISDKVYTLQCWMKNKRSQS